MSRLYKKCFEETSLVFFSITNSCGEKKRTTRCKNDALFKSQTSVVDLRDWAFLIIPRKGLRVAKLVNGNVLSRRIRYGRLKTRKLLTKVKVSSNSLCIYRVNLITFLYMTNAVLGAGFANFMWFVYLTR